MLLRQDETGGDDNSAETKNFRFQWMNANCAALLAPCDYGNYKQRAGQNRSGEHGAGRREASSKEKNAEKLSADRRYHQQSPICHLPSPISVLPRLTGTLLAFPSERAGTHAVTRGTEPNPPNDRHV